MTRVTTRSSTRPVRSKIVINSGTLNTSTSSSDSDEDTLFKIPPRTPGKSKCTTSSSEHDEPPVTPPKQKKLDTDFSTPTRNKENLFTKSATPSTLLRGLTLSTPEKKQEKKSSKKLNYEKSDLYQEARRALHSTLPTALPGREKELCELRNFIARHVNDNTSGTLYVSGPPGTGKTASLNLILENDDVAADLRHVYINCTAIKSAGSVYSRIVRELKLQSGRTEKENLKIIQNYLTRSHKMTLLILDEIDQLESKNQSVLYTIFEWPSRPNSKLILIGIANALDLTDRILPRLQARCELKPTLMHFASYSKQQIVEILTCRLKEAGASEVFTPVALQMLAGKVASISGDIRRALDIARRLIELVDHSRKNKVFKSLENLATELIENENNDNHIKSVNIKEVADVLNNVYGTSQNLNDESEDTFPLQQKIIICSLILMLKKAKNKDVTVGKLHEVYRKVCTKRNLTAVDQAEFVGVCALIETKGIIRLIKKKEPRLSKVSLEWDEEEVSNALKDKQLMSSILQDTSCLGKL